MAIKYAVFSADDGSLNFYNRDYVPSIGEIFENNTVTKVYPNLEQYFYCPSSLDIEESNLPPWRKDGTHDLITNVKFVDKIDDLSGTIYMFLDCNKLIYADLKNFDTEYVHIMIGMFENCSSLTFLDLRNFKTTGVENAQIMFSGCNNLTTIKVSELWQANEILRGVDMFKDCYNLVGAIEYDEEKTSSEYANYTNGYLTYGRYIDTDPILVQEKTLYDVGSEVRHLFGSAEDLTPTEMIDKLNIANSNIHRQELLLEQIIDILNEKSYTPHIHVHYGTESPSLNGAIGEQGDIYLVVSAT